MWFPGAETDPTEVKLAAFTDHVITASILLNRCPTLWTFLIQMYTTGMMYQKIHAS